MKALAGLTLALSVLFAGGASLAEVAPRPATEGAAAMDAPQQVLVLLRMPPGHARAGVSAGGGYGDEAGMTARRRLAQRLADAHGLTLVDGWPMPLLGVDCYIMQVPDGRSSVEVARDLARERGVEDAQPSQTFQAQGGAAQPVDDPLMAAQPATREWRLKALHELSTGRGMRVAVIDSMVDAQHPDLAGQVELTRNFVQGHPARPEDHGTGVAGVIAAREKNGIGIVGIAPGAQIIGLRACWQTPPRPGEGDTVCDTLSLAQALHFAIDTRADVINLSLSGPDDPLLGRLIDVAVARGVRVVAAYDHKRPEGGFPARHAGVVAVSDEALASASRGVYTAPGRDVPTTRTGGRWFLVDGSSFSAAHVSGLLALVGERNPRSRARLSLQSDGTIDACASLLQVAHQADCACALVVAHR